MLTFQKLAGKKVELPKVEVVSHEEVLHIGNKKADIVKLLVEGIVGRIGNLS